MVLGTCKFWRIMDRVWTVPGKFWRVLCGVFRFLCWFLRFLLGFWGVLDSFERFLGRIGNLCFSDIFENKKMNSEYLVIVVVCRDIDTWYSGHLTSCMYNVSATYTYIYRQSVSNVKSTNIISWLRHLLLDPGTFCVPKIMTYKTLIFVFKGPSGMRKTLVITLNLRSIFL